jgi:hypothetical protein
MQTNVKRSLTTLLLATAAFASAGETIANEDFYGTAPESLDYPTESKATTRMLIERARQEELATITDEDVFPTDDIPAVDPLSKKKVARVLVGPTFRARGYGTSFDYYRYVTFYNVKYRKERIYALPVLHEDCHDQSEVFGSYAYTHSYSATLSASITVEGLGLSSTITDTRTFSTSRNLRATGNLIADHTPYFAKQDWAGRTFMQTFTKATGKAEFIVKETKSSPLWIKLFFPVLASVKYPYDFSIRDADWSFLVDRTIVSTCSADGKSEGENASRFVVHKTSEKAVERAEPPELHVAPAGTSSHGH